MQEVMESRSQWVKKSRRMQAAQLNGAAFYFFYLFTLVTIYDITPTSATAKPMATAMP